MSASLTALATVAQFGPWGPGPWMGPWAAGFGWVTIVVPLLFIGLIVFAIVFSASRRRRYGWYGPGHPGFPGRPGFIPPAVAAEQTLAERFAKGDIDETEYRARLEVLRANRPEL